MAGRSSRIQELTERNDQLRCMWGLFSILESCQGHPRHKLISNGRRLNEQTMDYPRKLYGVASFDEECRKFQNGSGLRSATVDARANTFGRLNEENMPIDEHTIRRSIDERSVNTKMDSELDHRMVKAHRRETRSSKISHQSSSFDSKNVGSLINRVPSTSAEISLNKLTVAAILEAAVCAQSHEEGSELLERIQRSNHHRKYDDADEINIQIRPKRFSDRMSNSRSFSNALEVLNLSEGQVPMRIKNAHPSLAVKETVKSILDASSSAEHQRALALKKGNANKNPWQKSDKIVILKPVNARNAKPSESVISNSSSLLARSKSSRGVSDAKTTSFSFREMKRKLKHTFGVTRKDKKQSLKVGDECICGGVDVRNSFSSSTNSEQKGKLWKKKDLKSNWGCSDVTSVIDSERKKLDFSSVGTSNRKDFDVILEAKSQLSARMRVSSSTEEVIGKRSPKTLLRILSSPEHDFWPLSPRWESQYCSGSAQMRFSPYNTCFGDSESSSQVSYGRESTWLSPSRSDTEFTSCDGGDKFGCTLQLMHAKACSPTPSTEEEKHHSDISTTDDMKLNGESNVHETGSILQPELHVKNSDVTRETCINDTMHSTTLDSLSENEVTTSTVDDFPSTSLSIYKLDMTNSMKYQEEHRSPVSVLEPFYIEDSDSPPSTSTHQTGRKRLEPRRLDFEEFSFESITQDPSTSANSCMEEEDHLIQYVQLVVQASCLDWDQLSQIRCPSEELLQESLFDEVELPPLDCYYDPKLLFDHINEVLLEIYKCHLRSPPWLAFRVPRITSTPLADHVLDEIMTEADFYLLPRTDRRTLDQLVSKDVAKCRSWLDVRLDTERIVFDICEDVLEESLLDMVLEFHS